MRDKSTLIQIDNSNPSDYPKGRIKDNVGSGGTPINEFVYGDFHEMKDKLMRLYGIVHNNLPDNETNGYQFVEALIALASKNDYIIPLTISNNVLNVPLKLGKLGVEESAILYSSVSFDNTIVSIKGTLDNVTKNVSVIGNFKSGEFVRFINRTSDVLIVRDISSININSVNTDLGFLKKAGISETITGSIDSKAVTPVSFSQAVRQYLNGSPSSNFLANRSRNGLLSAAQWTAIQNISSNNVVNVGRVGGIDVDGPSGNVAFAGDAISATQTGGTQITITTRNNHGNNNYFVRLHLQSDGNFDLDNNTLGLSFRVLSGNRFIINIDETGGFQNLTIHFETVRF